MLYLLILILAGLLITVSARLVIERHQVRALSQKIRTVRGRQTNERITVETRQQGILDLANAVNTLYDDIYAERAVHARALDEMRAGMAGISHDLRTPLTSILGYLQLLQAGENTPEQTAQFLSVTYSKAQRLNRLVTGLFELARLEAGKYPFDWESINPEELLSEELAGVYDALSAAEGAPPVIDLGGERMAIRGDRNALSRIFSNLLQNIVKHGTGAVTVQSRISGDTVVMRFSNRAAALSEADVQRLFQRYYTADPTRAGADSGLGLVIAKELTEQMGGTIAAGLHGEILTITLSWRLLGAVGHLD